MVAVKIKFETTDKNNTLAHQFKTKATKYTLETLSELYQYRKSSNGNNNGLVSEIIKSLYMNSPTISIVDRIKKLYVTISRISFLGIICFI